MSNLDRKTKKRHRADAKPLGWMVPAKRQPLFPPTTQPSTITDQDEKKTALPRSQSRLKSTPQRKSNPQPKSPSRTQPKSQSPRVNKREMTPATKRNATSTVLKPSDYFVAAKRPIVSLYFLLPLILCYEIAKIFAGVHQLSSGIDLWIDQGLRFLGAGQLAVLPLLTTIVLLFYHHRSQDDWHVRPATFLKMAGESIGIGMMLFCFANLFQIAAVASPTAGQLIDPYYWEIGSGRWWGSVITYVGTGIHEELIFRMILLLPAIALMKNLFSEGIAYPHQSAGTWFAVIGISVLFAAAHVDVFNPLGAPFDVTSFAFRATASCLISAVFIYRGFGIVVGTHIVYNVLTLFA